MELTDSPDRSKQQVLGRWPPFVSLSTTLKFCVLEFPALPPSAACCSSTKFHRCEPKWLAPPPNWRVTISPLDTFSLPPLPPPNIISKDVISLPDLRNLKPYRKRSVSPAESDFIIVRAVASASTQSGCGSYTRACVLFLTCAFTRARETDIERALTASGTEYDAEIQSFSPFLCSL